MKHIILCLSLFLSVYNSALASEEEKSNPLKRSRSDSLTPTQSVESSVSGEDEPEIKKSSIDGTRQKQDLEYDLSLATDQSKDLIKECEAMESSLIYKKRFKKTLTENLKSTRDRYNQIESVLKKPGETNPIAFLERQKIILKDLLQTYVNMVKSCDNEIAEIQTKLFLKQEEAEDKMALVNHLKDDLAGKIPHLEILE